MNINGFDKTKANIIRSSESNCYIIKDVVYKVFKNNINFEDRMNIIKIFLNNHINGCPYIYDFIYNDNQYVGYAMKYYPNTNTISPKLDFNLQKEKCIELINLYIKLKNIYDICYYDFHKDNVRLFKNNILLFDIDSCLLKNPQNIKTSERILNEYILSIIYNTFFFDNEILYMPKERNLIRKNLYTTIKGNKIETLSDLKYFLLTVSKKDTKKVLKRIPYKITNERSIW
jgi:hypothetical protein